MTQTELHTVNLVPPSRGRYHSSYYTGPCDVCVTPPEVRAYGLSLSQLAWIRLCDDHTPVADLLKAARVLQGVASCG